MPHSRFYLHRFLLAKMPPQDTCPVDWSGKLLECCDLAESYPLNLGPRLGNTSKLKAQAEQLKKDDKLLFHEEKIDVHVQEVLSGDHC